MSISGASSKNFLAVHVKQVNMKVVPVPYHIRRMNIFPEHFFHG